MLIETLGRQLHKRRKPGVDLRYCLMVGEAGCFLVLVHPKGVYL